MARIHPTAVVSKRAELADDVEVGPFTIIEDGVRIGAGSRILSNAVVCGRARLGERNVVHPFAVIGGEPQLRKGAHASPAVPGALVIGDDNVFREHVTVNVSSSDAPTRIGSRNLLMTGCHVAHDVVVGSNVVIANGVQLAGHVVVEDWAVFGGVAAVAQHLRVGESAFVAGGAMCERDVPAFVIVQGDRARVRGLNVVGLERRGVSAESIYALKKAFSTVFVRESVSFDAALVALGEDPDPFVARFARSLSRGRG